MNTLVAALLALALPSAAPAQTSVGQVCEKDSSGRYLPPNNGYYQLVFDGSICKPPYSCSTWDCPKRVPASSWKGELDKKTLAAENRINELEEKLQADFEERGRAYAALPAPSATILRDGVMVASGTLNNMFLFQARLGDRVELGEGYFSLRSRLPAGITLVGRGAATILNPGEFPKDGIVIQDLVLRDPFPPLAAYVEGKILLARVKVDMFSRDRFQGNWDGVVLIGGSFGRISPRNLHRLSPYAFGTHVGTLNEDGDFVDMEALPAWVPYAALWQVFRPEPPKWKTTSVKKALARSPWPEERKWDVALLASAVAEPLPSDRTAAQQRAIAAAQKWLAAAHGISLAPEHPDVALMVKDAAAGRPLSAFYRAARMPSRDLASSEDGRRALMSARRDIGAQYACDSWLSVDKSKRFNATVSSDWDHYVTFTHGHIARGAAMVPAARYGVASPRRCRFVTRIGRDVFQEERVAKNMRVENTEWFVSSQGLAKQKAKFDAAMSDLSKSFDAAAASMERTWKTFDAYRTRIETSQSGEQVLVSYTGDRNKGAAGPFAELERLRRGVNAQGGPGAPGDYYPMTTYVAEVERRYRHVFEMSTDTLYDGNAERTGAVLLFDQSWSLPPCKEKFLDNSAAIHPAGGDCFAQQSPALAAALARSLSDYEGHVKTVHIPRLDASAAQKRAGAPPDAAEAALHTVLMGRVATPQDAAALAKVFGPDATPSAVKAAAEALLKTQQ